ncbi:hypothetical protein ABZ319_35030 [Nocardia sp. NPDC005978]|uniref:hypothetical protein n=1 Tax=Nocardia sp. NPDC005978 TaxID=3156725 RepID=UPI0033BF361B
MGLAESEVARLRSERAELVKFRAKLAESIDQVQHGGSAIIGEEYVAAREDEALVQTRIDRIDAILAQG